MPLIDILLPEYDRETAATRRVLDHIPDRNLSWRPHPTALTIGALAAHVARLPTWTTSVMGASVHDMATSTPPPSAPGSAAEIVTTFDARVDAARALLVDRIDGELTEPWTLRRGGAPLFTLPKIAALRYFLLNPLIQHRGELCVYLQMLDVELPAVCGPPPGLDMAAG